MRYLSVCSGIEAASVAWQPLGWTPIAFAEIADFPSRVLAHHYPTVPNLGDFTALGDHDVEALQPVDVLVAGTPCQSFSVAGGRAGLDDPRGVLALEFLRLAGRVRPRWIVWENVRGVLSAGGGRDFGAILGALADLGYGWAYRILDAQYFGVAQRRRRVFVVGCTGDQAAAAAVLFERSCLRGDPPPRRDPGSRVAGTLAASSSVRGWRAGPDEACAHQLVVEDVARTVTTRDGERQDPSSETFVIAFNGNQDPVSAEDVCPTIGAMGVAIYDEQQVTSATNRPNPAPGRSPAPTVSPHMRPLVASCTAVRRLTPLEKERLFGFPDGYTDVDNGTDAHRGHALGNSMAVPVMRWIGERIDAVEAIVSTAAEGG